MFPEGSKDWKEKDLKDREKIIEYLKIYTNEKTISKK